MSLNNLNSRYVAPSVLNQQSNGRDYAPLPNVARPPSGDRPTESLSSAGRSVAEGNSSHSSYTGGPSQPARGLGYQILRGLLFGSILALIAVLMLAVIGLAGALYGWLGIGVTLAGLAGVWFVVWRMAK